eukprot:TCALIF_12151-PA protein Name:"Protein of unknown function" AED:0.23 eAED:0.23 QI:0/1/0/1/1/1/2/0/229
MTTIEKNQMSLVIHLHDENGFLENPTKGQEFLRSTSMEFIPQDQRFLGIIVAKTKRISLNHSGNPCHEDENWDVIKCIEEFIVGKMGCTYPGILKADLGLRNCSSLEDMLHLLDIHKALFTIPSSDMAAYTGCLRPCHLNGVDPVSGEIRDGSLRVGSAISYLFRTTNVKVAKEAWFYDFNSLVAEVGGSLGLFLGASLLTLFQHIHQGLSKLLRRCFGTKSVQAQAMP